MTRNRPGLSRLFPAAALLAALSTPLVLPALAEDTVHDAAGEVEAVVEAVAEEQVADAVEHQADEAHGDHSHMTVEVEVQEKAEPEKSPEELQAEQENEELNKLKREAQLRSARLSAELAPLQEKKQRLEAEIALLTAEQQAEQAKKKLNKDQADFEQQLELAKLGRDLQAMQQQLQQMTVESQMEKLEQAKQVADLAQANAKLAAEAAAVQAELGLLQTRRSAASVDKDPMRYPANPLDGKALTISDRRIPLNGAIGGGTADYVTERIHYYNNLDGKAPIFICIDSCPGGSVMEGYRIVTAMQNSEAPVHVVVKSYAASMAAVITTLAEESYCYPNAIILHHQMSSSLRGNLTQQKEALEEGFEWAKRLADPVAEKMGVSYDEFVELMYKNNSSGDWAEFGDEAIKLKWVNHVVEEVRETALVTAPTTPRSGGLVYLQADVPERDSAMPRPFSQAELFHSPISFPTKLDGNGRVYTELPPLQPFDYYFLHDPAQQYRIAK